MVLRGIVSVWAGIAIIWHSAPARADAAEVEALIAKGNELRRAGTPGPALPYFQKAYELARTPRTSGQLGLAELSAGYPVDAAEHLTVALQTPNDPSIVKYRKILTDALATARSQIGELTVEGTPVGAEVSIDGRAIGVLPLSAPLKLAANSAEVVIRAPGYEQDKELVTIAGGQRHALTVKLEKVETPAEHPKSTITLVDPPSTPVAAPMTSSPVVRDQRAGGDAASNGASSALRTAAWVAAGAAIVATGAGLALNLAARSNQSDFNGSCVNMDGIHMVSGQPLTPAECEARSDAWQTDRRWSIAGYIGGAALAITSGVLFWTSRPTPTNEGRAQLTCTPTPTGLSCQGLF